MWDNLAVKDLQIYRDSWVVSHQVEGTGEGQLEKTEKHKRPSGISVLIAILITVLQVLFVPLVQIMQGEGHRAKQGSGHKKRGSSRGTVPDTETESLLVIQQLHFCTGVL
jgi:hypothetical protein